MENPWSLLLQIAAAGIILIFLFFRKGKRNSSQTASILRVEVQLLGELRPPEVRLQINRPTQLVIHRFDTDPEDELFEIDALSLYEILPAKHTTIIAFTPEVKGNFPIVLAGEREAGRAIVE